jgi:hypothetical protein
MLVLFGQIVPHDAAGQERLKKLSDCPAVDDFTLIEDFSEA